MIVIRHGEDRIISGRLTTIGPAFRVCNGWRKGKKGDITLHRWMHVCQCVCGAITVRERNALRTKKAKSCGCQQKEIVGNMRRTHGMTRSPVYQNWRGIIQRCTDPTHKAYPEYGGRGITVCDRWREHGKGFQNFLEDMGPRPDYKRASIDRIDNDGNYCPENCRWATNKTQCNNRRTCHYIEYNGERKTWAQWSETLGGNRKLVERRIKRGWDPIKAITTPTLRQQNE